MFVLLIQLSWSIRSYWEYVVESRKDTTGSFRKNDKSKTVSIGINFHKYCFFWGVLGSKFAANLPSLHWEHVLGFRVTGWHRPIGGSDLMRLSLKNRKPGLSWSLGQWKTSLCWEGIFSSISRSIPGKCQATWLVERFIATQGTLHPPVPDVRPPLSDGTVALVKGFVKGCHRRKESVSLT